MSTSNMSTSSFRPKVGDKVRFREDYNHYAKKGDVAFVTSVDYNAYCPSQDLVYLNIHGNNVGTYTYRLELDTPAKKETFSVFQHTGNDNVWVYSSAFLSREEADEIAASILELHPDKKVLIFPDAVAQSLPITTTVQITKHVMKDID